jgi:hypothetical protein
MVPKTLVSFKCLIWLMTQEDFIKFKNQLLQVSSQQIVQTIFSLLWTKPSNSRHINIFGEKDASETVILQYKLTYLI